MVGGTRIAGMSPNDSFRFSVGFFSFVVFFCILTDDLH